MTGKIKIVMADDSSLLRAIYKKYLGDLDMLEVLYIAVNGKDLVDNISVYNPDMVITDIEMPEMTGYEAIPKILKIKPDLKILVLSSVNRTDFEVEKKIMEMGAKGFLEKPSSKEGAYEQFRDRLIAKIADINNNIISIPTPIVKDETIKLLPVKKLHSYIKIISIIGSTGAVSVLSDFFKNADREFFKDKIIFITQHIKTNFDKLLSEEISKQDKIKCKVAEDNDIPTEGTCYISPANSHMVVKKSDDGKIIIKLDDGPPENFCKPSADTMLRSLNEVYDNMLLIVLTGMGSDGLEGAKLLAAKNHLIIAQDQETSMVWGMPGTIAKAGLCSAILPDKELFNYIKMLIK